MTVQWYSDALSHGNGQMSRLGTACGTLLGTAYDIPVHAKTIRGTP